MATPYLGEILIVPYNFAPKGFAFCNGQILSIQQNTALFSLLGTTYGGNGTTNFALPDLQGRTPVSSGQGPGLSQRDLGEFAGESSVTLLTTQIPSHTHQLAAGGGTTQGATQVTGGGQPHNNRSPYLTFNFVIAMQGIFPARN